MAPVLCQALRTFVPYAERHGYELRVGSGESEGRPAAWAKVVFLRQLLREYDEVLWLDADIAILDPSEDLAAHVRPDAYQALVETRLGDLLWVNSGVWFLRAGERSDSFLYAVWNSTDHIDHIWWENAAVVELLGYDIECRAPRAASPWSDGTQMLPEEWNIQMDSQGLRPARIRHYSAQANDRREQWIRADADRVSGNPAWLLGASRRWAVHYAPKSPGDLVVKLRRRALVALASLTG